LENGDEDMSNAASYEPLSKIMLGRMDDTIEEVLEEKEVLQ